MSQNTMSTREKGFQKHKTQIHGKSALSTMTNDEKVYARKGQNQIHRPCHFHFPKICTVKANAIF
jgi:hypothetical protein